jgi:hypothetical protein
MALPQRLPPIVGYWRQRTAERLSSIASNPGLGTGWARDCGLRRPLHRSSSRQHRNVAFWHDCDIILCPLEFRLRRLSGRGAEAPEGPGSYAKALENKQVNCLSGIAPKSVDPNTIGQTFVDNLRFAAAELKKAGILLIAEPIKC